MNKGKDILAYIEQAIDAGFSHVDTAQRTFLLFPSFWIITEYAHTDYNNESSVGTALRNTGLARSAFFITSKYFTGNVEEEVRNSLEKVRTRTPRQYHIFELFMGKLGLKQLDLYLIHFPDPTRDTVQTWKEFEKLKEAGLSK